LENINYTVLEYLIKNGSMMQKDIDLRQAKRIIIEFLKTELQKHIVLREVDFFHKQGFSN
jgi:hypothetical protein